jgi:hypothetical protein
MCRLAQMTSERRIGRTRIQRTKIQREGGAMAETSPNDVIARYGNFYRGDDDLFAHCFVRRSGQSVLLFQGLQTVTLRLFDPDEEKHRHLAELLEQPIPSGWPQASYQGYNFVTDPQGPNASEIAVYGVQPGDPRPPGEYYAAPADSEVGELVKDIAKID